MEQEELKQNNKKKERKYSDAIANEQEEKEKEKLKLKQKQDVSLFSTNVDLADGIVKALGVLPKQQRKKIEIEIQNQLNIEKKRWIFYNRNWMKQEKH